MCLGHLNSHLFLTHPEAHTVTTTTCVSRMRFVIICHWSCPKVSCFEHELSFKQQIVFRLYRLLSAIFKKPLRSAYFCLWSYLPAASSLPPLSTASSQLAAATQRRPHYPLRRLMLSCLQARLSWERAWKSECGLCLYVHAGEIGKNARDLLQKPVCSGVPSQRQGKVSLLAVVLQGLHLQMPWDCTNCFREVLEPERVSHFCLHNPVKWLTLAGSCSRGQEWEWGVRNWTKTKVRFRPKKIFCCCGWVMTQPPQTQGRAAQNPGSRGNTGENYLKLKGCALDFYVKDLIMGT